MLRAVISSRTRYSTMSKHRLSLLLVPMISAGYLTLTGCAGSSHEPAEKYILVADNTKISYWQSAAQGLGHAAAEMKVKSEVQGPDGHDPQAEHDAFKHAVAEKTLRHLDLGL